MFKLYGEEVPISIPQDVLDPKLSSYQQQKNPDPVKNNSEKALGKQPSGLQLTGFEQAAYKAPAIVGSKPVAPTKKSKPYPSPFGEMVKTENDDDIQMSDGRGAKKGNKRKSWKFGKAGSSNASVRRMVPPKSPWTILEELGKSLDLEINHSFLEPVEEDGLKMFPCEVIVNGDPYVGSAPDADISQNIAAEMAIQAYVVHVVNNGTGEPQPELADPLDNAPWAALASLGLFKLFNDWQSRGFAIPMMNPPLSATNNPNTPSPAKRKKEDNPGFQHGFVMKPMKKLPDNPTSVHPVQLFNQCYPDAEFACTLGGCNTPYTVTVTVDGQSFTGEARNKKDAKKMCAIAAAKALLNVDYSVD